MCIAGQTSGISESNEQIEIVVNDIDIMNDGRNETTDIDDMNLPRSKPTSAIVSPSFNTESGKRYFDI